MNPTILPMLASIARHSVTAYGAILVQKGVLSTDDVDMLAGAAVILVGLVWSFLQKRASVKTPPG